MNEKNEIVLIKFSDNDESKICSHYLIHQDFHLKLGKINDIIVLDLKIRVASLSEGTGLALLYNLNLVQDKIFFVRADGRGITYQDPRK